VRKYVLCILFATIVASGPVQAKEASFCKRLAKFETTTLGQDGVQWVEFHWLGRWLDFDKGWGFGCRHSDGVDSRNLCSWLKNNTSFEFPNVLPLKILKCHGTVVGKHTEVDLGKSEFDIWDDDRRFNLMIDFTDFEKQTGAIRYIVVSDEAVDTDIEYKPIKSWTDVENKEDD